MGIQSKFASHQEAVKAGWFSRRHQTRDAHMQAQHDWLDRQDAKRRRAEEQRSKSQK